MADENNFKSPIDASTGLLEPRGLQGQLYDNLKESKNELEDATKSGKSVLKTNILRTRKNIKSICKTDDIPIRRISRCLHSRKNLQTICRVSNKQIRNQSNSECLICFIGGVNPPFYAGVAQWQRRKFVIFRLWDRAPPPAPLNSGLPH